ncbi:hypothetical protein GFL39_25960 [Rhizobium leguminosarum bv. viciae]|uniref:hypothetical protein n=1 Tax=Rhizobium leguminosarum TaxID=384 RepID=UPI0014422093|nr:hypothetical protein [Rhizobium leguminosarum]NKL08318.1 hypothetical protein [Rhizobium leguminosarum bv. viciae]
MKLWIPDIGDKIILTADWTFSVINEGRNSALWQALGLEKHPDAIAWNAEKIKRLAAAQEHEERHRTVKRTTSTWGYRREWDSPENEKLGEELWLAYREAEHPKVDVTFPKDTCLTIDRVYIRKGASEFSSLTFFIGDSPMKELQPVRKGGRWPGGQRRFFARLEDVNKIECDLLDA